jgi:tRNA(fMet)-specific endonuclease VapC
VVAGERGQPRLDDLIDDEDDVAIAAVTVAELLVGVTVRSVASSAAER